LQKNISEAYNGLDVSFDEYPKQGKTDPDAYKTAIDALPKGSASELWIHELRIDPLADFRKSQSSHQTPLTTPLLNTRLSAAFTSSSRSQQ
jgi:D-galacturonate reductase